jgi:hypothetical protein
MKILYTIAALVTAVSAFAQGTIVFQNRNIPKADGSGTYNVPIWEFGGTASNGAGDLPGGFTVGLFDQSGALLGSSLLRTDPPPSVNSGFFATAAQTLTVPNAAPGSTPTLIVRGWQGPGTFAQAQASGTQLWMDEISDPRNQFTTKPLGGTPAGGGLPITPPGMTGWGPESGAGITIVVPEPSTFALSILGVAAFCLFGRKSKARHV